MMMGGSGGGRSPHDVLLHILNNPEHSKEVLKKHKDAETRANLARVAAKDAEDALAARQAMLNEEHEELEALKNLHAQAVAHFEAEKQGHAQQVSYMGEQLAKLNKAQQEYASGVHLLEADKYTLTKRQHDVEVREKAANKRHDELDQREAKVAAREQFIHGIVSNFEKLK